MSCTCKLIVPHSPQITLLHFNFLSMLSPSSTRLLSFYTFTFCLHFHSLYTLSVYTLTFLCPLLLSFYDLTFFHTFTFFPHFHFLFSLSFHTFTLFSHFLYTLSLSMHNSSFPNWPICPQIVCALAIFYFTWFSLFSLEYELLYFWTRVQLLPWHLIAVNKCSSSPQVAKVAKLEEKKLCSRGTSSCTFQVVFENNLSF